MSSNVKVIFQLWDFPADRSDDVLAHMSAFVKDEFGDEEFSTNVNMYQQKQTGRTCVASSSKTPIILSRSVSYLEDCEKRIAKSFEAKGIPVNVVGKHSWPDED